MVGVNLNLFDQHENENKNTWLIILLILGISLHLVLMMSWVTSFLPHIYAGEVEGILLRGRKFFSREYDLEVYRLFIIVNIALSCIFYKAFKNNFINKDMLDHLKGVVVATYILGFIAYWVAFEIIMHHASLIMTSILAIALISVTFIWFAWIFKIKWFYRCAKRAFWVRWLNASLSSRVISISFIIRFILAFSLIWIFVHRNIYFHLQNLPSLPYFWPLRDAAVGVYTLSFIIPAIYMAMVIISIESNKENKAYPLVSAWQLILSVLGLLVFLMYVYFPVIGNFKLSLWPIIILTGLSIYHLMCLGFKQFFNRLVESLKLIVWGSILAGAQAALLFVWIKEHAHLQILPADFSSLVYVIFIIFSGLCYFILRIANIRPAYSFIILQVLLTALMSLALFKLIVYDYRGDLARSWFWLLGLITMAEGIVWFIGRLLYKRLLLFIPWLDTLSGKILVGLFLLVMIVGAVYVPDIKAMEAHIFMGEYMHHTDTFVMGPAWAVATGGTLDVDVYSRYGIGSVYVLANLMKVLGGISYFHLYLAIIWICVFYYVGVVIFLRRWLGGWLLALSAWMMVFKAQNAFELAYPFVYTYPQSSVVRQWPDILWMIFMLLFVDTKRKRWLIGASVTVAFTTWYMPSIGLYMLIAQGCMSLMMASNQARWQSRIVTLIWPTALSIIVTTALFIVMLGPQFLQATFWHNAVDFMKMFLFTNTVPITDPLIQRKYLHVIIFSVFVLTYVFTIVKVILNPSRDKQDLYRDYLALGISVYGLGLLEHYVAFSMGNNYYSKSVPFFAVLFYWFSRWFRSYSKCVQGRIKFLIFTVALVSLVTNHGWMSYPNIFNVSKNPLVDMRVARPLPDGRPYFYHKHRNTIDPSMRFELNSIGRVDEGLRTEYEFKTHADLINAYNKDADFSQDAALISSLTAEDEKVALISSYDVRILIQAKRKPFFFFFPLLATRPMQVRNFPDSLIDTKQDMANILAHLSKERPRFIFLERIMLSAIPKVYETNDPGLVALIDYVKSHYVALQEGRFLTALKRKDED